MSYKDDKDLEGRQPISGAKLCPLLRLGSSGFTASDKAAPAEHLHIQET